MDLGELKTQKMPTYFLYITFLLLPFANILSSISLGLLLISSLIFGEFKNWKSVYSKNKSLLLPLVTLYIALIISLLWTDNYIDGIRQLEHRVSFILIPLALPYYKFNKKHFIFSLYIFSFIMMALSIIIILESIYNLEPVRQLEYFGVHRSYQSMYVVISALFLLTVRKYTIPKNKILIINTFLVLLFLFILIMNAKLGIISFLLLFIIFFKLYKSIKSFIILSIMIGSLIIININSDLYLANRFTQAYKEIKRTVNTITNPETTKIGNELGSTGHRILVYKSSLDLINNSYLYGYGVGGTVEEIRTQNYKNGYIKLGDDYNLNAHNDFMQLGIELGIGGLILLFFLYYKLIYLSIKRKHIIFTFIFSIFLINGLVESILVRQAGIIIFILFITIYSILSTFDTKLDMNI